MVSAPLTEAASLRAQVELTLAECVTHSAASKTASEGWAALTSEAGRICSECPRAKGSAAEKAARKTSRQGPDLPRESTSPE